MRILLTIATQMLNRFAVMSPEELEDDAFLIVDDGGVGLLPNLVVPDHLPRQRPRLKNVLK